MKKLVLSQAEIDKLVVVDKIESTPTALNVGIIDVGFQLGGRGKEIWQYCLWYDVMTRCFSEKFKKTHQSYKDVTCCDEWLSFATFLEWVNKEVGYSGKPQGYCLDKDLITKGNKIYSPKTCSFVPMFVNNLFTGRKTRSSNYPVGVHWHSRDEAFIASIKANGKGKQIGTFNTPEEAFLAYKVAKEAQIKAVANQYKDVLKPAVYESLMNWEIEP